MTLSVPNSVNDIFTFIIGLFTMTCFSISQQLRNSWIYNVGFRTGIPPWLGKVLSYRLKSINANISNMGFIYSITFVLIMFLCLQL